MITFGAAEVATPARAQFNSVIRQLCRDFWTHTAPQHCLILWGATTHCSYDGVFSSTFLSSMAHFDSQNSVPVVDISGWIQPGGTGDQNKQQSADQWHYAMKEFGCVILVGHGIEEDVFGAVNDESRNFFGKSLEHKLQYNHGAYGHPSGGYSPPGNEIVALSTALATTEETKPKFDPVETFVFTSHPQNFASPSHQACPLATAADYYERMEGVLRAIHSVSSAALGLSDIHYFEQFYDATLSGNEDKGSPGIALKVAHYPPLTAQALQAQRAEVAASDFNASVRYGAHTDYQGFTILRPDKNDWHHVDLPAEGGKGSVRVLAGGLEVYHRTSEQWIQVRIPKHLNALVINAGDFIQRWTNDIWHSPLHRVVTGAAVEHDTESTGEDSPVKAGADRTAGQFARQSIVFFSGPLENCVIECIDPALMKPEVVGDTLVRKYAPIRSGDHLLLKLNRTNGSNN